MLPAPPPAPFKLYRDVLTPKEVRELLQTPLGLSPRTSASLLDIASGRLANACVEHTTERGRGRVDVALTPSWARSAASLPSFS